jgi:hypothetical protein
MANNNTIYIIPDVTGKETYESPSISFDVVTAFAPTRSRTVTELPISTGEFISEFLSNKSGKLSIEAYVSNNPIFINKNNLISSTNTEGRDTAAYIALDALYKSENTVTIRYKYDTLNSYFLTDFEPILMPSDAIGFRLEFSEVRFATEKRVQLSLNMSDTKTKEAAKKQNAGQSSPNEATEEVGSMSAEVFKDVLSQLEGIVK